MQPIIYKLILYIICSASIINCCCNKDENRIIRGTIYYANSSNKLRKIDLLNKERSIVYEVPRYQGLDYPNKVAPGEILLERVQGLIQTVNINTKNVRKICEGTKPKYIEDINTVFYYKWNSGLYQKKLDKGNSEIYITGNIHTNYESEYQYEYIYAHHPVQISKSEIAYFGKNNQIQVYNYIDGTIQDLEIYGYEPWAYYNKANAIICKNISDKQIYFVNLDTLQTTRLNLRNPSRCIIVVDAYNCLIYSKKAFGFHVETEAMYIYWVDDEREQKYMDDVILGNGFYMNE